MGRLTSAVHWWEESQMRVLVLGSLVVQFLLLGPVRLAGNESLEKIQPEQ